MPGSQRNFAARHRQWHVIFVAATWYVILGGTALAVAHSRFFDSHLPPWLNHTLACLLIIAPFLATYALAIQTIHDTRRRRTRYEAMARYLQKQIEGIERSRSSVARLRLIATTERRLIEELHEWHSVTRHVAV